MNILVLSYSFTGNNEKLASELAKTINANHISITDKRDVSVKTITMDLIFHRKSKNNEDPNIINNYDLILYVAPFWLGKIARPLRPFFKVHRQLDKEFAFLTVSGGALGKNKKYKSELKKRIKKAPLFTCEFYTADLLENKDIKMKETSTYIIDEQETKTMVSIVSSKIDMYM
ncbi:MAG: Flavodoxin domain protein [Candidatus Izimaplasma bacterium HR2]|nr:MAG: Flavodoxin domain protein [Candidatus Izimaplasma bacterium HR2]